MIGCNLKLRSFQQKNNALKILLCCVVVVVFARFAQANAVDDFQRGWKGFHSLLKNPGKSKYRSSWMEVRDHFQKVYRQSPNGSLGAKSLYYLGRVYQELGKRSYLNSDSLKAIDYFNRVQSRFPKHSWADDAKLKKAEVYIYQLKNKKQAGLELRSLLGNYPRGDMRFEAKKLLARIGNPQKDSSRSAPKKSKKEKIQLKAKVHKADTISSLQKIRHWSSSDYTRVVIDLEHRIDFKHRLLKPDPKLGTGHRLFVDLKDTRLGRGIKAEEKVVDGILRKIRAGQYQPGKARVVLDIDTLENVRVFSLDDPFRIVVDVFTKEKVKQQKSKNVKSAQAKKKPSPIKVSPESKKLAGSLVEQLGLKVGTIMIDAGHGGKDPGAMANKLLEKNINLRMAKILGNILSKKGFKVLYTRTKDVFIPLEERTAMANSKNVDLFISVHCNAHSRRQAQGLEVYYLNLAKSKDAVRVAARENSVSIKKISDLQFILTDLMLNSKINESRDMANIVHDKALQTTKKKYKIKSHGVKEAPFYVLMGAKMPAILIELGYLTNFKESKNLNSNSYLTYLAQGIANGILAYKKKIEKFAYLK